MRARILTTLILALLGAAILVSLGIWQLQRHQWKQAVLAEIETRIAAAPAALPAAPDPQTHRYRPVTVAGMILPQEIRVQASRKFVGAGYRIIAAFETEAGRRILIDRGFIAQDAAGAARPGGAAEITGNMQWPDEVDVFTPPPDRESGLWFARDVPALAEALGTEPVLIVVRHSTRPSPGLAPLPLDSAGIPNNHLGYAVQWFLMATAWVAMAGAFLRGQWRKAKDASP